MVKKMDKIQIPSAKSEDLPATRKMLSLVRDEILHKLDSGLGAVRSEMESGLGAVRGEIAGLRSEFHGLKSEFQGFKSELSDIKASNSRMLLLFEEQNANNRIVLEGMQALWQRQERIELQQR